MKKVISVRSAGIVLLVIFGLLVVFHVLVLFQLLPSNIVWGAPDWGLNFQPAHARNSLALIHSGFRCCRRREDRLYQGRKIHEK